MDSATISRLFSENSSWMKQLAQSLVRDEGWAEDVVQETWRELVERPPARSDSHTGWMRKVVRNLSLKKVRGEDRRARRQVRAARPEAQGTRPDCLVERLEVHQRIVSLVLSLEEPYRSTVLLRFFEDLRPADIARLQQVPATTVRSRLRSALETLRRGLDRSFGGEGKGWRAVLVPCAVPEAFGISGAANPISVPAQLAPLPAPTVAAVVEGKLGAVALTTGAIFMSQKVAASLGVVLGLAIGAGVGGWYGTSLPGRDPGPSLRESADPSGPRVASGLRRAQEDLQAALAENTRLKSLKDKLQNELDAVRKQLEEAPGVEAAGGPPASKTAGLDWSGFSSLLTEHLEMLGKVARGEKLTPEEQADHDLVFSELQKLSSRSRALHGAPFFDRQIFSDLVKSLYQKPLGLSESQRAQLEELTGSLLERLPENAEELSSLDRYRQRRELAARLEDGVRKVLEEDQLPAWEAIHDFSGNVFAYGGDMKFGLSGQPRMFMVNWCSNALGENYSEERFGGVTPLAEDYLRQAAGVIERYGQDNKSLEMLPQAVREKLNADLLRLQEGFLEQVKPHLDEDLKQKFQTEEPLIIRFEYGNGTGIESRRRLF